MLYYLKITIIRWSVLNQSLFYSGISQVSPPARHQGPKQFIRLRYRQIIGDFYIVWIIQVPIQAPMPPVYRTINDTEVGKNQHIVEINMVVGGQFSFRVEIIHDISLRFIDILSQAISSQILKHFWLLVIVPCPEADRYVCLGAGLKVLFYPLKFCSFLIRIRFKTVVLLLWLS